MSRSDGALIARAAQSLVGTPFRLHGRDPVSGMDCVGLVLASLAAAGRTLPAMPSYRLRHCAEPDFAGPASALGLAATVGKAVSGDVLAFRPGPAQVHLAVRTLSGIVHAHAALCRIVSTPFPPPWPMIGHWRALP